MCYAEFPNCPSLWNSSDPKGKFLVYALIMNNKIPSYSVFVKGHTR